MEKYGKIDVLIWAPVQNIPAVFGEGTMANNSALMLQGGKTPRLQFPGAYLVRLRMYQHSTGTAIYLQGWNSTQVFEYRRLTGN